MNHRQAEQFYTLYNCLCVFANKRLGMFDDVLDPETLNPKPKCRHKVMAAAFADIESIVDAFVRQNPFKLEKDMLQQVEQWKYALTGEFIITELVGDDALILCEKRLCLVRHIVDPLRNLVPEVPVMAKATLLPFDGEVTFAVDIVAYPVNLGPGILSMLADETQEAQMRPRIETADQFIEFAQEANATRRERDFEKLQHDLQRESDKARGIEKLPAGIHRGVLAGLSEEERKAKVHAHTIAEAKRTEALSRNSTLESGWRLSLQKRLSMKRKPYRSLAERYAKKTKAELVELLYPASSAEEQELLSKKKQELAKKIATLVAEGLGDPQEDLKFANEQQLTTIQKLLAQDSPLEFTESQVLDGEMMDYKPYTLYVELFYYNHTFTLVLLDEQRERLANVDFDALYEQCAKGGVILNTPEERMFHVAEVVTTFCGIYTFEDACALYDKWYGTFDEDWPGISATDYFIEESSYEYNAFGIWRYRGRSYIINWELDRDMQRNAALSANIVDYMEYLVERHEEVGSVTFDESLSHTDPLDYIFNMPAAIRLRNYLDAHVPDESPYPTRTGPEDNDYLFAERAMENIEKLMAVEFRVQDALEVLDEENWTPSSEMLEDIMPLLTAFHNSHPIWANNGYSPDELLERQTGHKVFYNEDGKIAKVGRNDPCPCGSGKKYKKCCGR